MLVPALVTLHAQESVFEMIFPVADYGLVVDLFDVLPALESELKADAT